MPIEVILPRVDMDMTAGKISKWHVKDGDLVKKGGLIFEIETDKAAMEIESPGDGVIRDISVTEGTTVPTGSVVAMIYAEGDTARPAYVPKSQAQAFQKSAPLLAIQSEMPGSELALGSPSSAPSPPGSIRATPLARNLARNGGIALNAVAGSGPRGRIVAEDVRLLIARPMREPQPAVLPAAEEDQIVKLYEPGSFETVAIDGMRRTIAQRLVQSKQAIPHFYLAVTCDLETLLAVRARLNGQAPKSEGKAPQWKLSVNDFVIKAMASALQRVPDANVTWTDNAILKHRTSDVGVAVAIPEGLFTPVIRKAETKSLSQISMEMKDLAGRARARKLLPSEYRGGTTAVSNLGMFGIEQFTAIINPPHATILAVGAATPRPAVVDGALTIRTQMTCTLSCDHRAVDGALGAELLAAFRSLIEDPAPMLV